MDWESEDLGLGRVTSIPVSARNETPMSPLISEDLSSSLFNSESNNTGLLPSAGQEPPPAPGVYSTGRTGFQLRQLLQCRHRQCPGARSYSRDQILLRNVCNPLSSQHAEEPRTQAMLHEDFPPFGASAPLRRHSRANTQVHLIPSSIFVLHPLSILVPCFALRGGGM